MNSLASPTLGFYVQIPFCASKCSFCNFSSQVERSAAVYDSYLRGLEAEVAQLSRQAGDVALLTVDSIYLGGGTPSLFGAPRLARLFSVLRARFTFAERCEATIEITPNSADDALLAALLPLGFDRLSIGAQSFDDRELRSVGRLHTARDIHAQVAAARRAGFGNISLDLLAGLPYQSEASWQRSIQQALRLRPEHLSVYLFEADEKSRLGREVRRSGSAYHADAVPSDDFMADAYQTARHDLTAAGYAQYEISNFALPGYASLHNRKYWQMKPYLGMGAGAHSFDGTRRWSNLVEPKAYVEKLAQGLSPTADCRSLPAFERAEEFFFLGLRQREGVRLDHARRLFAGLSLDPWERRLRDLASEGWLKERDGAFSLTDSALLVSNEIFERLLL